MEIGYVAFGYRDAGVTTVMERRRVLFANSVAARRFQSGSPDKR
jgi:hypothetical protein